MTINTGSRCNGTPSSAGMSSLSSNGNQLWLAASRGDHNAVAALLKLGASPNVTHDSGKLTALHAAAQHGSLEVVRELLQQGALPNARTTDGSTALHLDARRGHTDAAAALLGGGASLEAKDNSGSTPLLLAAIRGDMATMQLLLKAGADVAAASNTADTPLHGACDSGTSQVASLLLERGAAVDAANLNKGTPLHLAAMHGHADTAAVLLRAGASLTATTLHGDTPLHLAAGWGKEDVVRLLLCSGADPTAADLEGWLPLHYACQEGHAGVVHHLLHHRQESAHVNATCPNGDTPLHLASSKGHAPVVQLLVKAGADVHARSGAYRMPLHQAIRKGHTLVVEVLLAAGADPGALTRTGANGLHLAAMWGHVTILQQLLAAMAAGQGGDAVNAEWDGMTPLQYALEGRYTDCMKVLLAGGADPNKLYGAEAVVWAGGPSLAGCSSLHRAVMLLNTAAVPLLATPANMAHVFRGATPLHAALIKGIGPGAAEALLNVEKEGLQMAQALVAAGSPAGVAAVGGSAHGATAMSMVAGSKVAGYQALLPAMVRRECQAYKQKQQEGGPGGGLAAVVHALCVHLTAPYIHLAATAGARPADSPGQVLACFQVVMEVLGPAVGGGLLQQVVGKVRGSSLAAAARRSTTLRLCTVLHAAWLAAVQPLMQQRERLTNRTQRLVSLPLQQEQQQQQQRPPWPQAPRSAAWASKQSVGLKMQASAAAAAAGQWPLFVQLLDQLTGLHKPSASAVLKQLQQQQQQGGKGADVADLLGLCEALLGAWQAAVLGLAGRMQRELAGAVVGAVQAARQQQQPQHVVVEGGVCKRQRTSQKHT